MCSGTGDGCEHTGTNAGENRCQSKNNTKEVERSLSGSLQSANEVFAFTEQRDPRGLILFSKNNTKISWQVLHCECIYLVAWYRETQNIEGWMQFRSR